MFWEVGIDRRFVAHLRGVLNMKDEKKVSSYADFAQEEFLGEESVYNRRIRALLVDDDALRSEEEAFMEGYEEESDFEPLEEEGYDEDLWISDRNSPQEIH